MAISAQDVNKLRQMTGAGMMDCKKALQEANGDFDEAITILRKQGQKVSEKRADREANEGVVFAYTAPDATEGVVIALKCETDFVAKNEEFVALGNNILNTAVAQKPANIEALLDLAIDGLAIREHLIAMVGKIGEKIEVGAYEYAKADTVVTYIHYGAKLGVLLSLNGAKGEAVVEAGKDVCLQIAAMNPIAIDKDGVDADTIAREIEIGKDQARQEGKPEAIIEKIAMGKLEKFYKERTLLHQEFVKDSSMTIAQMLKKVDANLSITNFKRVSVA
ncbi:translation elongation factor Ts [Eisenibacter elegans]|uniref:translation elongation factor Ts n=1 Tax=Eisenibacter elegans TaxID=997 RepID=UPI00042A22BD|nr:translation elongation factor Ts [Eisenibacter elegans]